MPVRRPLPASRSSSFCSHLPAEPGRATSLPSYGPAFRATLVEGGRGAKVKLKTKFLCLIVVLLAVSLGANLVWTSANKHAQMENELREQGRALAQQMDAVWEFMVANQDRLARLSPTTACTRGFTAPLPVALSVSLSRCIPITRRGS